MTAGLVWVALGLLLCRPLRKRLGAGQGQRVEHAADRRTRVALPPTGLRWVAGVGVGLTAVLVTGWPAGAVVGAVAAPLAVVLVGRLQKAATRRVGLRDRDALPLALDLLAAVLRSGQPLSAALDHVGEVVDRPLGHDLQQVAALLRLGATPEQAWHELTADPVLAPVARAAVRSADSGIRLSRGFEQVASDVRAEIVQASNVKAHRAGVWAMAPLGLCFLPAFVCLGIIPVVVGVGRQVYPGLGP